MRPNKTTQPIHAEKDLEEEIISSENHQDNFDQFENDSSDSNNVETFKPDSVANDDTEKQEKQNPVETVIDEREYMQVEVESRTDMTLPYKQRRSKWGFLFFAGMEKFYPAYYKSLILNQDFKDFSGSEMITLGSVELGAKYNTRIGSFSLMGGYSAGSISNPDLGLTDLNVAIYKTSINYAMDNLFQEPYVVPYVQTGVHLIKYLETSVAGSVESEESNLTDPIYHFRTGLLFQLNWLEKKIDPNTHYDGLMSSGLENTFIDVFYSYYASPLTVSEAVGQDGDPDFESSEYGVGLKLEF